MVSACERVHLPLRQVPLKHVEHLQQEPGFGGVQVGELQQHVRDLLH